MFSHSAMAARKRAMLSAMSATKATVVSIKARKFELALVNPVAYDLGRTRCTPSREVRKGPPNHESTRDPEEAIGPRSETIVVHDLAAGPTRHPSGKGNKRNGTFPPSITNTSSKKLSLLGVW